MKDKFVICVLIIFVFLSCKIFKEKGTVYTYDYSNIVHKDSLLIHHMKVLDSVVSRKRKDTVYFCCISSIDYLQKVSKIGASTDGTLIGRMSFTKGDWQKWKDWFEKKYNLK